MGSDMATNADNHGFPGSLNGAIIEASPYGILVVDSQRIVVLHNRRFAQIWQIPDELFRHPDSEAGPRQEPILAAALEKVADPGAFQARLEVLYGNPDLDDVCEIALRDGRTLERQTTSLRNAAGQYLGRVWFFRDITQRKRIEKDLLFTQFVSDHAPDIIFWVDQHAHIDYANEAACRSYGYTREELQSRTIIDIDYGSRIENWPRFWEKLRQKGKLSFETRQVRKDGSIFLVEVNANLVSFDGKEYSVSFHRDATERKRTEQDLKLTQFANDHAPDSILWFDREGRIIYVNDAAARERGYTKEELLRMSILDINPAITAATWPDYWKGSQQKGALNFEGQHRRKDGSLFPVEVSANFVHFDDREIVVAFIRNITERKATENEIRQLAFHDPLTRLPNRRLLQDRLQQAIASSARSGRHGALLYIDLDNFKTLNDTLGHGVGDQLLQRVAKRLGSCVREGDTVARIGGDEFLLILEDLSELATEAATQVRSVSGKIFASLGRPYLIDKHECISTPSIGALLFNGHQHPAEELMKRADIAMYQAKKSGRNTLRFFDPDMQAAVLAYATLEKELRHAIKAGQFRLHYQVQVDAAQRLLGVEALMRWEHPERGLVQPAEFIHVLEETGLITTAGHWLLDAACAQIKSWQRHALTRDLVVAINVSAREFSQPDFAEQVGQTVVRHAIPPRLLKLELTESLLISNEGAISTMNKLNDIGVQLTLDDFGTGYSSLQYLRMLPLDQLKIDRSFVSDLATDSNSRTIVRTIIAMAHSLDLDVIAEGVETLEQRRILLDMGCASFQGYLFGKPMTIEHIEEVLHRT